MDNNSIGCHVTELDGGGRMWAEVGGDAISVVVLLLFCLLVAK